VVCESVAKYLFSFFLLFDWGFFDRPFKGVPFLPCATALGVLLLVPASSSTSLVFPDGIRGCFCRFRLDLTELSKAVLEARLFLLSSTAASSMGEVSWEAEVGGRGVMLDWDDCCPASAFVCAAARAAFLAAIALSIRIFPGVAGFHFDCENKVK
jgi:hypothetical protein